jgi:adenine phosphoribosyltransferase
LTLLLLLEYYLLAGGSAAAATELVTKLGGDLLQYLFIAEVAFLEGRGKLGAPVYSIVKLE